MLFKKLQPYIVVIDVNIGTCIFVVAAISVFQ